MTRSLNNRIAIILALMLAASGIASLVILNIAIAPAFRALETHVAATDLGRANRAIDTQQQQLTAIAGDWAPWNAPNAFVKGENPDFIWTNVDLNTLRNIEIELLEFFDVDGKRLWTGYVDNGPLSSIDSLGRLGDDDPLYDMLKAHDGPESVVSGLLMTARGPMLLVSMPLVEEALIGPVNGTMLMGRLLTPERLQTLQDHVKVPFDIVPMQNAVATMPAIVEELQSTDANMPVHTVGEQDVHSYLTLADITGDPLGVLVSRTARDVTMLGEKAADFALLLFVAMALVLLGLTWLVVRRDIVARLERLAEHMAGIRRSGDLSARIAADRDDEIGRLGRSFNALTGELQQARRELVERSFRAGRADNAAEILHNVSNAMTPVINVTEDLAGAWHDIGALQLARAAGELVDPDCPEDRRDALLHYVQAAAAKISATASDATSDVNLIRRQARLVGEILAGQENIARFQPLQERLNLAELASEAAAILPAKQPTSVELHIAPALADTFVLANRVQLLQVLGNVLLNAFESVERAGAPRAHIALDATEECGGEATMVRLSVSDNGAGLDPADITRIFQREFSSKTGPGHGIGLHWCANTIRAMGGSMEIESEGVGNGATVYIRLPMAATAGLAGIVTRAPG